MSLNSFGHTIKTTGIQTTPGTSILQNRIYTGALLFLVACLPAHVIAESTSLKLASSDNAIAQYKYSTPGSKLPSRIHDVLYKELDLEQQLISFLTNYPDGNDIQTPMLQYRVGMLFKNGRGLEKSMTKAIHWLQKSADKNYAAAQFELGLLHKTGNGVHKDLGKARELFNKARENGYSIAQDKL